MSSQEPSAADDEALGFDTLQLQVGTRLQLNVTRDLRRINLFSSVIGYVRNEYLLLQVPVDGSKPFPLRDGERLTVRVFSGVQVCWFHAVVLKTFMHPFLYMHVSFPKEINGSQLRAAMRVRVSMPAQVALQGGGAMQAEIQNLSTAGAYLETAHPIPAETDAITVGFALQIEGDVQPMRIDVQAAIRNRSSRATNDPECPFVYAYGVQFAGLDPTHRLALQNQIYETLMTDRQKLV